MYLYILFKTILVLNKLYKSTSLQSSFSVNNIALVKGKPEVLNLKEMIHYFVEHRHDVVVRRTTYELRKAEERAHILIGLATAVENIDEVIKIIKNSKDSESAKKNLLTNKWKIKKSIKLISIIDKNEFCNSITSDDILAIKSPFLFFEKYSIGNTIILL